MCSKIKTGTRYSAVEDKHILKCVAESNTICSGISKAAKHLGRSENAVLQRYYLIKKNAKTRVVAQPKTDSFMSKHQKMLDQDVRFSLASLARDHESITIEVRGKQITAVFR